MKRKLTVTWIDRGFEPRNPPDPKFPAGMDIDLTKGQRPCCTTALPYPAKRCGYYVIKCATCGNNSIITTAGRVDDPRSVKMPCVPMMSLPGEPGKARPR